MAAAGETDLERMLATLDVRRRTGEVVYVRRGPSDPAPVGARAMIDEDDAISYVVPADGPEAAGGEFRAVWLTLTVRSSLDAVGLTAAVAAALARLRRSSSES